MTNPEGFEHALRVALSMGITGDSCDTVGQAITDLRQQTFAFYIQHATLSRSNKHGGVLRLVLPSSPPIADAQSARRFAALKDVHVHTYPYVLEALETFQRHGLIQGICTSSGKDFVYPLLGALALQSYFKAIVTADCVPTGHHKPAPYPWHHLRSKLDAGKPFSEDSEPITDMICVENSASGGLSAIRASKSPTFVIADNIAATVGKMHAKIRALDNSSSGGSIHGTATFIDDLGALVVPRTSSSYKRQSPAKRAAPEAVGSAPS
jgi:beta-phosphoglucomutase-like phosphatase (HAD superfamily)